MSPNLKKTTIKRVITLALLVGALGAIYGIATHPRLVASATGESGSSDRKVLYWYDAMNPQHHYDKPGRAPDGMDLVPAYADHSGAEQNAASQQAGKMNMPGTSERKRKILYWYDPMHPAYKSDKAGVAPDCGMTLVPKYLDDGRSQMPPGAVIIPEDKQVLAGVRTMLLNAKHWSAIFGQLHRLLPTNRAFPMCT